ncbi:MAG TPA: zinc ribbon domain-containing protein [Gemmatales bacterium]|nr:zinc ribbon domain-containing protein [Gemmatales bacterium]HMP58186.1 zinc ribbon domain-containing protein [Gemmatales bacterium]
MPTYEYRCNACGHQFEEFQSIKDDALTKCPKCKKKKLERLIGAGAALLFKGSGFYITDYRSASYQEAAKKDSAASGEKSGSGDKSSGDSPSTGKASGQGKKSKD